MAICCRNNTTLNLRSHWFINSHRLIYLVMINNFGMCFYTHRFCDTVCTWARHGTAHTWCMIYAFNNCDLFDYFYIFCVTIFHTCNRRISKQGTGQQYKKHFFHNNTFICFYSPAPLILRKNYNNHKSKVYKKIPNNGDFFYFIFFNQFEIRISYIIHSRLKLFYQIFCVTSNICYGLAV